MPEPVRSSQRYMPGLDGLRALAVLGVVAFHLGIGWAGGGLLGVGVFFTLSGYLITDLLLGSWSSTGRLVLGDFWLRRARRLLPALGVMLVVVVVWVALLDRSQLGSLWGAVAAAGAYVSNWWLIAEHSSYFARFGPPSPLGHLWSLAVEEQFYLIWPWLLWLGLRFVREHRDRKRSRPRLAAITLAAAGASAAAMAAMYQPGFDPTRVYDGTDTRAFGVLLGAALALLLPSRGLSARIAPRARHLLDGGGAAGLAVIALLMWRTSQYSAFLYRGGMVVLSVATVLVITAVVHPACRLGAVLGWRPLRWLGIRSYGIYLWHFPVIVLTSPHFASGFDAGRAVLQFAAIVALAALSWRFVEEPVRHGALGRLWERIRTDRWRPAVPRQVWLTSSAAVTVLALTGVGLSGAFSPSSAGTTRLARTAARPAPVPPTSSTAPATSTAPTTAAAADSGLQTSCRSVVHIGDSTSEGLTSPSYLPDPSQRIGAQYAKVGVTTFVPEISGARSIVETLPGQTNAYDVARQLVAGGYKGCWVLALGTNDTANVFVGSTITQAERIDKMMSVIGDQPVMWVNVKSLLGAGPYSEENMQLWDRALVGSCARYPNMRVYDWASVVQDGWFISDGIHFTSAGYAARARMIADALARAFPAAGGSTGGRGGGGPTCVVH